jgi:cytidylate kinase
MPLVTITRSLGSGELEIARRIADELDVTLYDDFELKEAALKMGIRSEDLKSLDEKAPGFIDRIFSRTPELYVEFMEAVVYEVARQGEGVIMGHGSQILLRDFGCALHVFMHASEAARIQNLMTQQGLSKEAAEKLIRKSDHEQRGFFRYTFNMRLSDPSLYDLIINTEKMGSDAATKIILEAARSEEIKACSLTAVDAMERLSQQKKVRATLIENDVNVSMVHVEVPVKGIVEIRGFTYTNDEKDRIREVANEMPGISEVKTDITVMPSTGD